MCLPRYHTAFVPNIFSYFSEYLNVPGYTERTVYKVFLAYRNSVTITSYQKKFEKKFAKFHYAHFFNGNSLIFYGPFDAFFISQEI